MRRMSKAIGRIWLAVWELVFAMQDLGKPLVGNLLDILNTDLEVT